MVRNDGHEYTSSDAIGPSYGVFIYDAKERLLFRSFGAWGPDMKRREEIKLRWNTASNHLGQTSEPPFVLPAPGSDLLKIELYGRDRSQILDVAALEFDAHHAEDDVLSKRPQPWKRRVKPILSATTTKQNWSRVTLYSPHVIRVGDKYQMWYIGNSSATRRPDMVMGFAESDDGITWREYEHNPILTLDDLPWGSFWQTPFVMFDQEEGLYKMWFVSLTGVKTNDEGRMTEGTQKLGYATSRNGIQWKIHPKPIFDYGRRPCVIKERPGRYRMWMNSGPIKDGKHTGLLQHIYEFTSTDGLEWTQAEQAAVQPTGMQRSIVYPYVIQEDGRYYMWHASHVPNGKTEIFCDESDDGLTWTTRHERAAFPASSDPKRFDARYTSTPCVLVEQDRYLLYYSARDLSDEYVDGDGNTRRDRAGVYQHIGVAVCPRR